MASSGNFAVLNELAMGSRSDLAEADTLMEGTGVDVTGVAATIGITSGKWYWEMTGLSTTVGSAFVRIGLSSGYEGGGEYYSGYSYLNGVMCAVDFKSDGSLRDFSSQDHIDRWGTITLTSTGIASYTDGDVIGIAFDFDNKKLWFSKNGTFFNSGDPAGGSNQQISWDGTLPIIFPAIETFASGDLKANFGQDSTFGGRISAGGNADENGFGDFKYTPPTGYLALCTANIPISDDIDPAQTDDDYPAKNFNVITYTGTGSGRSISGLGFRPDLVWIQNYSSQNQTPRLTDSSRGATKTLQPSYQSAESTESGVTSFDSDGFTLGAATGGFNTSSASYVAWCWKFAAGTTTTNNDGNLTATVQANSKAGQSIVQWTGNATNSRTLGTGLSKKVEFMILKDTNSSTYYWICYHKNINAGSLPSDYGVMYLNTSDAYTAGSGALTYWDISEFTDTVFSVGGSAGTNRSGSNMIAYCFHSVDGYSKFGSYNGSGNGARGGPFVYTGFRPRLIFIKSTETSDDWIVIDTARTTVNVTNAALAWNNDGAQVTSNRELIVLANGFKIQTSNTNLNKVDTNYIFGAWGDVPFNYGNTFG